MRRNLKLILLCSSLWCGGFFYYFASTNSPHSSSSSSSASGASGASGAGFSSANSASASRRRQKVGDVGNLILANADRKCRWKKTNFYTIKTDRTNSIALRKSFLRTMRFDFFVSLFGSKTAGNKLEFYCREKKKFWEKTNFYQI